MYMTKIVSLQIRVNYCFSFLHVVLKVLKADFFR